MHQAIMCGRNPLSNEQCIHTHDTAGVGWGGINKLSELAQALRTHLLAASPLIFCTCVMPNEECPKTGYQRRENNWACFIQCASTRWKWTAGSVQLLSAVALKERRVMCNPPSGKNFVNYILMTILPGRRDTMMSRMMLPSHIHILIIGTCGYVNLYGKRDFVDGFKDLEVGKLSWIFWESPM